MMSDTTQCNMCLKKFDSDDELESFEDKDGRFLGCPECETDQYLMDVYDLDQLKADLEKGNIQPEVYTGGVVIYRAPWGADRIPPLLNFALKGAWSSNARLVYISKSEKAILTFCEGDMALSLSPSSMVYEEELITAQKFYQEESQ